MAAFRYTAGLRGTSSGEVDDEEIERRETMKKLRRRPLSETLEQLGEGRGKCDIAMSTTGIADSFRYLRSRIRGEEATEDPGEVRHRCKGSAGLDATRNFLGVYNRSRHRLTRIEHFALLVHTTCFYKFENDKHHQVHSTFCACSKHPDLYAGCPAAINPQRRFRYYCLYPTRLTCGVR